MATLISIATITITLFLVGCSGSSTRPTVEATSATQQESMFVRVERTGTWQVVYHKDTKVMYVVSDGSYNYGTFTVLVNPDGTPMLYEE